MNSHKLAVAVFLVAFSFGSISIADDAADKAASEKVAIGEYNAAVASNDFARQAEILSSLAGGGNASAQYFLAKLYVSGTGVPQDSAQALKWLRLAAEQGDRDAEYYLGMMHIMGSGLPQDLNQAAKWLFLSATQGYIEAQAELGSLYLSGRGIEKDAVLAEKWLRQSADGASPKGMQSLAVLYSAGDGGLEKDNVEAYKLTYMANALFNRFGDERGADSTTSNLNLLKAEMTAAEISKAEDLARASLPK